MTSLGTYSKCLKTANVLSLYCYMEYFGEKGLCSVVQFINISWFVNYKFESHAFWPTSFIIHTHIAENIRLDLSSNKGWSSAASCKTRIIQFIKCVTFTFSWNRVDRLLLCNLDDLFLLLKQAPLFAWSCNSITCIWKYKEGDIFVLVPELILV